MTSINPPEIKILSEQAVLLDWGSRIDIELNRRIHKFARWLQEHPFEGFTEVLPAYSSLAVFFDPFHKKFSTGNQNPSEMVQSILVDKLQHIPERLQSLKSRIIEIPVLYNGPDLKKLAVTKNLPVSEIIRVHTSKVYDVFMLGFLPGFAYMGFLDEQIAAPRLANPRTLVPAGSVGIAGNQTGIYPMDSPGGWQLIGVTPLKMFDPIHSEPTLLMAGDQVTFRSVSESAFFDLKQNL